MTRGLVLVLVVAGCPPGADAPPPPPTAPVPNAPVPNAPVPTISAPPPAALAPPSAPSATAIPAGEPLQAGRVEFTGVVRPTKGGYHVRGVAFDGAAIEAASEAEGHTLLGAMLRVVAVLEERRSVPPPDDGIVAQTRTGGWRVTKLVEAEVVAPPVELEGVVSRSKGLFQVGDRMVSREDLAWSLSGVEPVGTRVRLWGQPRDYQCHPMEQCLTDGVIPMFDVGRAELLP